MPNYLVTHYYHSGFSVACEDTILIFDYWLGEDGELAEKYRLTPEILGRYRQIYVFISHDHPDHLDPEVFTWKDLGGNTLRVHKMDVTVVGEYGGTTSIKEDVSYYTIAYGEDRAISDGDAVMEYLK